MGAVVNVPLVPGQAALRVGLEETDLSGYIDRYANIYGTPGPLLATGVNDERATVLHASLLLVPVDGLTITPSLFFQRDQTGDTSVFYPALGLWQQDKEVDEYGRDTSFLPSLTATQDLGFATLTSISGYFWREFSRQQDGTYYDSYAFAHFFVDPLYSAPQYATQTAEVNQLIANIASPIKYQTTYGQISEELRLTSPPREQTGLPLNWQVGLYYSDQWDHHTNFQQIPGVNTTFQRIFGYSMDAPQSLISSLRRAGESARCSRATSTRTTTRITTSARRPRSARSISTSRPACTARSGCAMSSPGPTIISRPTASTRSAISARTTSSTGTMR